MKVLMKCGHATNSTLNGKPCCPICFGIKPGATEIVESPDLIGRKAYCTYCGQYADSSLNLAFFEHRPDYDYDSFCCGCHAQASEIIGCSPQQVRCTMGN